MAPFQMRKRTDAGAGFDGHFGAKKHMRLDHRVAADEGVIGKIDAGRVQQGHAVLHRSRPRGLLEQRIGGGQFGARVDAQRFRLGAGDDAGTQTARTGQTDDVRQVKLARRIVVGHIIQQRKQRRRVTGHDARIA